MNEWNATGSEARSTDAPTTAKRSELSRHLITQERRWIEAKEELMTSERARLKEIERESQELRTETAFLKKPVLTWRGSSGSEQV